MFMIIIKYSNDCSAGGSVPAGSCATHALNVLHISAYGIPRATLGMTLKKTCRPERNEVESNGSHQITWAAFLFIYQSL